MATNEHQTHDLLHPTCERCHEEMFGTTEEFERDLEWAKENGIPVTRAEQEAAEKARTITTYDPEEAAYLAREAAAQADPSTNLNEAEKAHLNDLYGRLAN